MDAGGGLGFAMGMEGHAISPEGMQALGAAAAESAVAGAAFALMGGLGAGKTHWTKGFVAALGSAAEVTSPTFSLVHEYRTAGPVVVHLDFYRLESPEELLAIGWDEMLENGAVVIAEWADKFPELMPEGTRWLRFSVEPDETRRVFEVPRISR